MTYSSPIQNRARDTEMAFLDAMETILARDGFSQCRIDDVAILANRHRGAFLKRFGSKEAAARVLFDRFAADALLNIRELEVEIRRARLMGPNNLMIAMSNRIEMALLRHKAMVRSLPELLSFDPYFIKRTRKLVVEMARILEDCSLTVGMNQQPGKRNCLFAARILVSLNFSFVASGCGAVREKSKRHTFIAETALRAWTGEIYQQASAEEHYSAVQTIMKVAV